VEQKSGTSCYELLKKDQETVIKINYTETPTLNYRNRSYKAVQTMKNNRDMMILPTMASEREI
jgi:hypothetical protein